MVVLIVNNLSIVLVCLIFVSQLSYSVALLYSSQYVCSNLSAHNRHVYFYFKNNKSVSTTLK